ncbi:MAG: family 20 glycosylhydrolase [Pseudoflavonifractor sp.]|nr:family 20 glycosylhydrolase [Alloprevotella sp.]MCM1115971.1 family 20 glycosylhydrolase [Pseudoflavonifractor sp.]
MKKLSLLLAMLLGLTAMAAVPQGEVIFRYDGSPGNDIAYRIPALARVTHGPHAGRLIAIADHRYCGGDIGAGRIDLLISVSDDNGATWTAPAQLLDSKGQPVARGTGAEGNDISNLDCGFGDAAIVADNASDEVFMLACAGRQNLFSSTRENPQPSARWWSYDGGDTWTAPDFTLWEEIYGLFDGTTPQGRADGQFVGSGRIMQSRKIKADKYYRLYAVNSVQTDHGKTMANYVLYSDDFGRSWHILGDPMKAPVPSDGDEPKAEELPDGSVLLAGRGRRGGRHFNIFRYTDPLKAQGSWGEPVLTQMGVEHGLNACNGEILIVPARSTSAAKDGYLALQSVPYGPGRKNVGIFYKPLMSPEDYDSPDDFASGWEGFYQVSDLPSAYSTMIQQADGAIGFLYEETGTPGHDYNIVYKRLPIEQITSDRYSYIPETPIAPRDEAAGHAATQATGLNLTPRPASIEVTPGSFTLAPGMKLYAPKAFKDEAKRFITSIKRSTGIELKTVGKPSKAAIAVTIDPALPAEGYTLKATPEAIAIAASAPAGLFYAFQTVKKLLGHNVALGIAGAPGATYALPCLAIEDAPRFGYRGFMLDVSRHFFSVDEIKRILDLMAIYKMNRFHWHLTDDQGWRIESTKYPKLNTIGATAPRVRLTDMHAKTQTWVNEPYGPFFYTKKQLADIIAYARERHIEIIPEVDMPGHFVAALCAYPEYSTSPEAKRQVWSDGGISADVLNVASPEAVQFAKDIIGEVIDIFPYEYIHIGGDECPTSAWENNAQCQALMEREGMKSPRELQSRFTRQMADYIKERGRKVMVWNEALTADGSDRELIRDIDPTIFCWVGADKAVKMSTEMGLNAIYTPWGPYYINRTQGANEPPGAGYGVDDVRVTYATVPFSSAVAGSEALQQGVQGTFWTEHVSDPEYLEYLMLPRLQAVAEAGWTPQELKDWPDFQRRMSADAELLDLGGYSYTRFFMLPPAGISSGPDDKGASTR